MEFSLNQLKRDQVQIGKPFSSCQYLVTLLPLLLLQTVFCHVKRLQLQLPRPAASQLQQSYPVTHHTRMCMKTKMDKSGVEGEQKLGTKVNKVNNPDRLQSVLL